MCADYQIDGADPVAPSAVAIKGQVFAQKLGRMVDYPVPQALDVAGIKNVVQDAVKGARNAMDAGFDGVELHFANGETLCHI
jgi:N-ethylmaleimide reductase